MSEPRTISFFVPGIPRPGGSKTASVVRRKGGAIVMVPTANGGTRPLTVTRDDAKGNAEWKSLVAFFARQAYHGAPLDCLLCVRIIFHMPRPKGHSRTDGTLKPGVPTHAGVKPDLLKLARSTEDACTGILWIDDSRIMREVLEKPYADGQCGAQIEVTEMRT